MSAYYFVTYRVRIVECYRDGRSDRHEWAIHSTVVDAHPVTKLLKWKKELVFHCGNAPKKTDASWLENEWQLLWWSEIPEEVYLAAHKYEDSEGAL